jgi:hypothetical protein
MTLSQVIPLGYPPPVLPDPYYEISGYYLNGTDLQDVAVLSVISFAQSGQPAVFAKTAADFFRDAIAACKKKMIIDLSGNGGGELLAWYNLFSVFFPGETLYAAARFRSHKAVDLIGQAFSQVTIYQLDVFFENPLAVRGAVTPNQTADFASWKDLFGPHNIMGVQSSSLYVAYNFTATSTLQDPVNGFGPRRRGSEVICRSSNFSICS